MTTSPGDTALSARPFLKWAGGKAQMLEEYNRFYPAEFKGYHEPFVGGGAVYFHLCHLQSQGEFGRSMTRVRLTDNNQDLINAFQVVQYYVNDLIRLLRKHRTKHSEAYYYALREADPRRMNDIERAARMIYLNKTCFNGLYRVNKKGQFNVPMGRYKNPQIFDEENLLAASAELKRAEILCTSFRIVVDEAGAGDFVYFDPPYYPLGKVPGFTSYTKEEFKESDHRILADVFRQLHQKGCLVMLSSSSAPLVLELFSKFRQERVKAARLINSKTDKRGRVTDVVILNY